MNSQQLKLLMVHIFFCTIYIFISKIPLSTKIETLPRLWPLLPFIYIDCVIAIDRVTWKTSVLTPSLVLPKDLNGSITAELNVCSTTLQNRAEAAPSETSWDQKLQILNIPWPTVIHISNIPVVFPLMSHYTYIWNLDTVGVLRHFNQLQNVLYWTAVYVSNFEWICENH